MNSSRNKASENLARPVGVAKSHLFQELTELANLPDDIASFERFARRWPGFIHVEDEGREPSFTLWAPTFGTEKLPEKFVHLWSRREDLRQVWKGNSGKLMALLLPGSPPEELSREEYTSYVARDDSDTAGEWGWPPQLGIDWQRSQFVYKPRTEFQMAVYELFRHSALAKVCANPDCVAPYFIAGRTAQRYCSDVCSEVFQREWKRRWWKERGAQWRRKKSKEKRGKH